MTLRYRIQLKHMLKRCKSNNDSYPAVSDFVRATSWLRPTFTQQERDIAHVLLTIILRNICAVQNRQVPHKGKGPFVFGG